MSYYESNVCITLEASADLSADQYKFVTLGATGIAVNTVAGGACLGVLDTKPNALGVAGAVAVGGVTKVKAGAAVARGADVQSDATGLAITAVAPGFSQGTALEAAAASGDIIAVLLRPNAQLNTIA